MCARGVKDAVLPLWLACQPTSRAMGNNKKSSDGGGRTFLKRDLPSLRSHCVISSMIGGMWLSCKVDPFHSSLRCEPRLPLPHNQANTTLHDTAKHNGSRKSRKVKLLHTPQRRPRPESTGPSPWASPSASCPRWTTASSGHHHQCEGQHSGNLSESVFQDRAFRMPGLDSTFPTSLKISTVSKFH